MSVTYLDVTELAGEGISREQLNRMCSRYAWAGDYCKGKDVLEVACGSGPGLRYLSLLAKNLSAGDVSPEIIQIARNHYKDSINIQQFDACAMPFLNASFDVILIFEAIYYLPNVKKFLNEANRVLRPGGYLLIVTANKDLYDFIPSPYSVKYYGVLELAALLKSHGFKTRFYGGTSTHNISYKQKILRPLKTIASKLGLIPKTMQGKKWLKKIVFGDLIPMPVELDVSLGFCESPSSIDTEKPNTSYKVIFCEAQLKPK